MSQLQWAYRFNATTYASVLSNKTWTIFQTARARQRAFDGQVADNHNQVVGEIGIVVGGSVGSGVAVGGGDGFAQEAEAVVTGRVGQGVAVMTQE